MKKKLLTRYKIKNMNDFIRFSLNKTWKKNCFAQKYFHGFIFTSDVKYTKTVGGYYSFAYICKDTGN